MNMHDRPQARPEIDWASRNQQWLAMQVTALRLRLAPQLESQSANTESAPQECDNDFGPALDALTKLFGLSPFEREIVLLAAGVELDSALCRLVSETMAQSPEAGASTQPTFNFAMQTLNEPHWDALSPLRPLRRWRLIVCEGREAPQRRPIQIDERVLHYLTGVAAIDVRLIGPVRCEPAGPGDLDTPLATNIAHALGSGAAALVALDHARGEIEPQRDLARAALAEFGANGLWLHSRDLPHDPREIAEMACLLDREAALSDAIIALELDHSPDATDAEARAVTLLAHLVGPAIVLNAPEPARLSRLRQRRMLRLQVTDASVAARQVAALHGLPREQATALAAALRPALRQFNVPAAELRLVVTEALAGVQGEPTLLGSAVWRLCRTAARGGLDALAQRIDCRVAFDDLVAPPVVIAQLRAIAGELQHRPLVHGDWGFAAHNSRGLGAAALFAGDSGTGKTYAAEAIASAAGLDLYRVDLASVVSKYIGETEKNLSRLFETAETSGAILLFDEADALFGKRSEVRDSHDRFANIEIAYLLQRIETYRGLVILTTNMKSALDRAFLRRIRYVIQFPYPDAAAREKLWRMQFPADAPLGEVDFAGLARLQLTGGNIRAIALNAAFLAAADGGRIGHEAINAAVRAEFSKLERPYNGPRQEV
ncbi:ATP-binding protein [Bradyrhizobium sp. OK095]|uniref:ATP-binding protein n=1 Tax=Bradyrhizobium sp. OK095 TaxID=1882760 RepID=UPI0008C0F050|nr:ATP-binding protein [Bradyrhizobium sp. OK095]SEM27796.1 ATPase family associated with various cellular activities (AAA) [Bradyrhizobium sp. OK095]